MIAEYYKLKSEKKDVYKKIFFYAKKIKLCANYDDINCHFTQDMFDTIYNNTDIKKTCDEYTDITQKIREIYTHITMTYSKSQIIIELYNYFINNIYEYNKYSEYDDYIEETKNNNLLNELKKYETYKYGFYDYDKVIIENNGQYMIFENEKYKLHIEKKHYARTIVHCECNCVFARNFTLFVEKKQNNSFRELYTWDEKKDHQANHDNNNKINNTYIELYTFFINSDFLKNSFV